MSVFFELEAYDRSRPVVRKPAWWALYTIALGLAVAIGLLEVYIPAGAARTVLECAVVVLAFSLMLFWRRGNRARWM
jgi:hypothetical protein